MGKAKILGIILIIGLGAITVLVLFRNMLPYGMAATSILGLEAIAPTAEGIASSVQSDPLGALKNGGIVASIAGAFTIGMGKL